MTEEVNTQVQGGGSSSADAGALNDTSQTQGTETPSSETGATDVSQPTVAELQKQHADREAKWLESYRRKEAELNELQRRLTPYEQAATLRQEEVEKINDAFIDQAAKIGYPAAFAELTAYQQVQIGASQERNRIVDEVRDKFIKAGKMPDDFDRFYNSRYWSNKEDFLADVDLHLKRDTVAQVTDKSKEEIVRQAEEDARRKNANRPPKGGGSPAMSDKPTDEAQGILDGMESAARRMNAARSEL